MVLQLVISGGASGNRLSEPRGRMSSPGDRSPSDESMAQRPEVVSSRLVYEGRIVTMRVDEIALPQGGTASPGGRGPSRCGGDDRAG